ncbi:MAG: AAA family ATPase [Minisyncoccota bacterium]
MHIIGHQKERERLQKNAMRDSLVHSYLFFGPGSIGKYLCAQEFAWQLTGVLDFQPSEGMPSPPDVLIIAPAMEVKRGVIKYKNISAETVRNALEFLAQFPLTGRFRVLIIDDADKMSLTAQNILLKTLEEARSTAIIILVTNEKGSILPTIVSRVEKVRFGYVPATEIRAGVSSMLPRETRESIASFFFDLGRPGIILTALQNPKRFLKDKDILEKLFQLSRLSLSERMRLAEILAKNVPDTLRLLEWWLPGLHVQAKKYTDYYSMKRFLEMLHRIERTVRLLKTTQGNARLLLETLFFSV